MLKCNKGLSLIIGSAWPPDRKTRLTSHVMYRLRRLSARERVVELQPLILRYIWQGEEAPWEAQPSFVSPRSSSDVT